MRRNSVLYKNRTQDYTEVKERSPSNMNPPQTAHLRPRYARESAVKWAHIKITLCAFNSSFFLHPFPGCFNGPFILFSLSSHACPSNRSAPWSKPYCLCFRVL